MPENRKSGGAKEEPTKAEEAPSGAAIVARLGGVPIELLMTAVRGPVRLEVEEPRAEAFESAEFRVDDDEWFPLSRAGRVWRAQLYTQELADGPHTIDLRVRDQGTEEKVVRGAFRVGNRAH